jgi:hypothetical protein
MVTVGKVTAGMFDDVFPLLVGFGDRRMSKEDWRRTLFQYAWPAPGDDRGYGLFDRDKLVGFIGTLFSEREIDGRTERFCNLSSWIVSKSYRARSLELLVPIFRLTSHTIVASTPSPFTIRVFTRFGFQVLDDDVRLLLPLATPRELGGLRGAPVTTDPDQVRAALAGEELRCFDDHRSSIGAHVLLRRGGRRCWATATAMHFKRCRFALLNHIGDPELFWECLPLAKWGFLRALGTPALAVDSRFAAGRPAPFAVSWRLSCPRLYRPAHGDLDRTKVDGLYSELVGLRM